MTVQSLRETARRVISWPGLPFVLAVGDAIAWTAIGVIWWKALA